MPKTRSEKNKKIQREIENEKIKKKSNIFIRAFLCFVLICALIVIYARYTETSGLVVNEYKVASSSIPSGFHGYKVIQLSDIHYGTTVDVSYLNKIVKKINKLKPDIVIFTGDLIQEGYKIDNDAAKKITSALSSINASSGKYACIGDEDVDYESYSIIMKNAGFTLLDNSNTKIYDKENEYIYINGVSSSIKDKDDIVKAFDSIEKDKYTISITHEYKNTDNILEYSPNLILSGHTLGGLIRIPFVGGVITQKNESMISPKHKTYEDTEVFNSYGIGTSTVRFRLFNKPSINLYRLNKNKND